MQTFLLLFFALGYFAIVFEHHIKINKAASALCVGVISWAIITLLATSGIPETLGELEKHLSDIASILIFLIGAMTIVEIIDMHDGFRNVTDKIQTKDKRKLLWIIAFLTFFLSSILDNLTTTIVMVSLISKLIAKRNDRLIYATMIIVAANAGGAWTPIGDVTTTMLWMGGNISTEAVMLHLFVPSLVCMIIPLVAFSFSLKGKVEPPTEIPSESKKYHLLPKSLRRAVLTMGVLALLSVPIFKTFTHLPPYMGMALALGIMWIYTEMVYRNHSESFKRKYSVSRALSRVDMTTIMFFLGILLCIGALQHAGILTSFSQWLSNTLGSQSIVVIVIGLISAVVDNVPLVAAAQGMYSYPIDDFFWLFLTYAAGTGGSILVIGSAAGVAAMGMEKIDFIWYMRKASGWIFLGYIVGAFVYMGGRHLFLG